ncbi:MAG: formate/nitrite transporter family protein [Erysipelotrichaceae bacterium]|nr:formate/nitrite transporter family protein [Erysipelotrichaceae bacterium]
MNFEALNDMALKKYEMCENDTRRFFIRSILAGLYLGLATYLSYTLASLLTPMNPVVAKMALAASFGIGIVLIAILGAELFTGNCFVSVIPVYHGDLKLHQVFKMWAVCYLGNFVGIAFICSLFVFGGSYHEALVSYVQPYIEHKLDFDPVQLLIKATLCNFTVCCASFTSYKIKDDTAKVIIMLIVVMAFVLPGFEHSIANMGSFTLGFALNTPIDIATMLIHFSIATLGNILGGAVLLGLPVYHIMKPE